MRQKRLLLFIPLVLMTLSIFVIIPYLEEQKEIETYAFELDSSLGTVKLSDFKGKIPIIYFGYMYCPDICPTSLSIIATALKQLPQDKADTFQLFFISVDPQRDTLEELEAYTKYFYPSAIGLTASENYLKVITGNYGTYYAKEYLENSKIDYAVAHTSFIYVMDRQGRLAHKIAHTENSSDVLEILMKMF